jgi:hypothetical protein
LFQHVHVALDVLVIIGFHQLKNSALKLESFSLEYLLDLLSTLRVVDNDLIERRLLA